MQPGAVGVEAVSIKPHEPPLRFSPCGSGKWGVSNGLGDTRLSKIETRQRAGGCPAALLINSPEVPMHPVSRPGLGNHTHLSKSAVHLSPPPAHCFQP